MSLFSVFGIIYNEKMKKGGPCNEEKHDKQASEDRNKASYVRPRGDGEIGGADAPRAKKEKSTDHPPQCRNGRKDRYEKEAYLLIYDLRNALFKFLCICGRT